MALPTNSSGGGLPKRPQQGQRPQRRSPQQGQPGNTEGQQRRSSADSPQRRNPGHGLPSIPQTGVPPEGQRPRREGGLPQRPQGGQLPRPQRDRAQQSPENIPARHQQRPASSGERPRPQRGGGDLPLPSSPRPAQPVKNQYDGDDDPFEELTLDEVLEEDDRSFDDFEPVEASEPSLQAPEEPQHDIEDAETSADSGTQMHEHLGTYYHEVVEDQDKRAAAQEAREEGRNIDMSDFEGSDELAPPHTPHVSEAEHDEKGQARFVSEDKTKLEPFGGKKRSRKIKVDEYDNRKNKERSAKIFKYAVLGGLGLLLVWNIIAVPYTTSNTVKPEEVASLVQAETGGTGFPVNAGEGFARDYMQAYLTYSGNSTIDNQALQYYQTGTLSANTPADNVGRSMDGNIRQEVVYGPTVYGVHEYTPYSAGYTIGALVNTTSTDEEAPEDGDSTRWEFFRVNVFFDPETEQFSIPPESPSLIPEYAVQARGDVPRPDEIGDGTADEALASEVQSVVVGFTRAWAESDTTNTTAIDQYIVSGEEGKHLQNGFGNEYIFANGDAESSITFQAYPNTIDDNVKVDMKVRWASTVPGNDGREQSVEYESSYIMTLEQQSDGRYLVSDFAPKVYVSSEVGSG